MISDAGRQLSRGPPVPQAISGDESEKLFGFQVPSQVASLCFHARGRSNSARETRRQSSPLANIRMLIEWPRTSLRP